MAREKEIKLDLVIPLDEFISRLESLGFEKRGEVAQRDNYFDTPEWSLYKNVAALRTREVDGKDHSFSFKKLFRVPGKKDPVYVEEIETKFPFTDKLTLGSIFGRIGLKEDTESLSSLKDMERVLLENGFQGEQVLLKTRKTFTDRNNNEIAIDDVDRVGTVVELECAEDEPVEFIKSLLSDSEWERSVKGTSYVWLEKAKGFTDHLSYQSKFDEDPLWNVLDSERELYNRLSLE